MMALRTLENPNNRLSDPFFLFPTLPSTKPLHPLVSLKPETPALSLTKPQTKQHKTKIPTKNNPQTIFYHHPLLILHWVPNSCSQSTLLLNLLITKH